MYFAIFPRRAVVPFIHGLSTRSDRRAIAEGEAAPGDRLPPARYLAAVLGVKTNTVVRALHTLRDEGLLEFRRGRRVTVTATGPREIELLAKVRELVLLACRLGYKPDELAQMISQTQS